MEREVTSETIARVPTPFRVGFCVSGAGRLFIEAVRHAGEIDIFPSHLVLDTAASADVERFARERGVQVTRLSDGRRAEVAVELTTAIASNPADLYVLTFDRILPAAAVNSHPGRIINVHLALLPAFKGRDALGRAIAAGVRFGGATIHEVDEEVDNGPIVAQCAVGIAPADGPTDLGRKVWERLVPMYLDVIRWYRQGRVRRDPLGRLFVDDAIYGEFPQSPRDRTQPKM